MSRRAFTLIEVLLAVALAVGILAGAIAFHHHAIEVRRIMLARADAAAAHRAVMDAITADLRGALVYPFIGMSLEGQADQVIMAATTVPGPAVWAISKATEAPPPPEHDVQVVHYRMRLDADGAPVGIERTARKVIKKVTIADAAEDEDPTVENRLLTDAFKYLAMRYWDGADWVDAWSQSALPAAVEVTIGAEPMPADAATYPYEAHRRVVALPVSPPAGATGSTTVRGLGPGGTP
jgi:prepilin-type N-terminal cleavage/methylation domain-containing protein